ncbi:MFS transporter [Ancylobacter sp. 6x-1]|uniref:MFS transporter n=1 Tax=Ancylobacter crimeensis TaxID=2579147 RepID=A0ABT0DF65_9HYPH|nr:MFS transporter [Ancylobacter crimeensis]
MYAQLGAIIVATSLVQLANGFFTTVISLQLALGSFSATFEGVILSAYFIGFTIGSVTCGGIIQRIGHIRSYAAFAGIVVACTAVMALWVNDLAWALLRAAIGFGCVGLFVTTESWLNAKAVASARGRVFSTYMVGTFLALALGQLLVGRLSLEGDTPFIIIMGLFAGALAIVSLTRADAPIITREERLPYGTVMRAAPLAVLGAGIAGMIAASFYAVVPMWMLARQIDQRTIGLVMLTAVLGGLAFQIPVGWLSDRVDRRLLLAILAGGFAASAVGLVFAPRALEVVLPLAFVFGGQMSTLYPVCVAHALDHMAPGQMVSVSGRLILVSGVGSTIGPFTATWIMSHLDLNGVLYFMAAAALIVVCAALLLALRRSEAPVISAPAIVIAPQAVQFEPGAPAAASMERRNPAG